MDAETRFNYLVGALGLLAPLLSAVWFTRNYRPRILIKDLDELVKQTVDLYESYVSDGLLEDESLRHGLQLELSKLQRSADGVRQESFKITTTVGDYRALLRGESRNILLVSTKILEFRTYMVRTSEKLKKEREEGDNCAIVSNSSHSQDVPLPEDISLVENVNVKAITEAEISPHI
ncbi:hypothetical protein DXG03_001633, partial [Asterophora parasitica]